MDNIEQLVLSTNAGPVYGTVDHVRSSTLVTIVPPLALHAKSNSIEQLALMLRRCNLATCRITLPFSEQPHGNVLTLPNVDIDRTKQMLQYVREKTPRYLKHVVLGKCYGGFLALMAASPSSADAAVYLEPVIHGDMHVADVLAETGTRMMQLRLDDYVVAERKGRQWVYSKRFLEQMLGRDMAKPLTAHTTPKLFLYFAHNDRAKKETGEAYETALAPKRLEPIAAVDGTLEVARVVREWIDADVH